jgi:cytochrome c oxidase subunit 1
MTTIDREPSAPARTLGGDDPDHLVSIDSIIGPSGQDGTGLPTTIVGWLTTTNHKALGVAYFVASLTFLAIGGGLAGIIRAELASPGQQVVSEQVYNQVFTIHGSVMVFLFAVPFGFGLANYIMPLQIGAPDLAFPRLNAFSFWLYVIGGAVMLFGFVADGGAAPFGWFAYPPLSGAGGSPGLGADMWIVAIILTGTSGTLTAVNVISTITMLRTPGMTLFRMPIMTWNLLVTAFMVLVVFPVLSGALIMLEADRQFGTRFFDPSDGGSPILWQHLFWFFGHPEVYIVALPFFGVVTEIFPVFARRPVFGYKGLIFATLTIGALSTSVWAHHMFVTGEVVVTFFALTSALIAIPTGVKVFNWIGSMYGGALTFEAPMKFAIGFLVTFVIGGVTGVMLASPTLDFQLSDSFFVVAHFHYVMGGTVVIALFAGVYFWWPKITGRMLSERLGTWHFWLLMIGFNTTFFFMHLLGREGMPRRVPDYEPIANWELWNQIASVGYLILLTSMVPFLIAIVKSLRGPATAGADPWEANSLEWATTSPPPEHNFVWLPPIRSERPVFDLRWINYDEVGAPGVAAAWSAREGKDDRWIPLAGPLSPTAILDNTNDSDNELRSASDRSGGDGK